MQANVVYGIKCQDCNQTYVGKTDRQMITRLLEHGAPKQLKPELINRTRKVQNDYPNNNDNNHTNNSNNHAQTPVNIQQHSTIPSDIIVTTSPYSNLQGDANRISMNLDLSIITLLSNENPPTNQIPNQINQLNRIRTGEIMKSLNGLNEINKYSLFDNLPIIEELNNNIVYSDKPADEFDIISMNQLIVNNEIKNELNQSRIMENEYSSNKNMNTHSIDNDLSGTNNDNLSLNTSIQLKNGSQKITDNLMMINGIVDSRCSIIDKVNQPSMKLSNAKDPTKQKKDMDGLHEKKTYDTRSKTKQIYKVNNSKDNDDPLSNNQMNGMNSTDSLIKYDSKRTKLNPVMCSSLVDKSKKSMNIMILTCNDNSLMITHTPSLEDKDTTNSNIYIRRSDRLKKKEKKTYHEVDQANGVINKTTTAQSDNHDRFREKNDIYKNSAIVKHQKDNNHSIDWRNAQFIWSDGNPHKLLIKESLIIKAYEPEMNRTTHSMPLYIYPNGISKEFLPRLNL